jgi:hypothetical protein
MPQNLKSLVTQSLYPKITTVTSGSATAVIPAGGETVTVSGSGFQIGCVVWINNSNVSTTFTNSTTLTFTSPAQSAGFYQLFVYNTDGSVATKPGGLIYNAAPQWTTPSGALPSGQPTVSYTTTVAATGGTITYSLVSGSLPTGLGLNTSTGVISGTPTTLNNYSFTLGATNEYNQTTTRSFSINIVSVVLVDYLVVAGGGSGGGSYGGGGGGAGGLIYATSQTLNGGVTYTVTVGAGGTNPTNNTTKYDGFNSELSGSGLSTVTAIGGGGGGTGNGAQAPGNNGGSGGGGGQLMSFGTNPAGGLGTAGQGNNGGQGGNDTPYSGGGGGGAGAVGGNGQANARDGGVGLQYNISGTATYYAGGGGSASYNIGGGGAGGLGGGGSGNYTSQGNPGTANTGGGGGAGGFTPRLGGAGGSGIVILRTLDSVPQASSTTGSPTITTGGGYRIYTFTGSGSITF